MMNQTQTLEIPVIAVPAAVSSQQAAMPVPHRAAARAYGFGRSAGAAAVLILTVAVVIVTALRVMPYQPPAFNRMFDETGWAGIRAGETTLNDALAILDAHPWVGDVQMRGSLVSWWWNGQQPAWLSDANRTFHGRIETALVEGETVVASLVLATHVALGDIALSLGDADVTTLYSIGGDGLREGVAHVAEYRARDMVVFNLLDCPTTTADLWNAETYIAFGKPQLGFEGPRELRKGANLNAFYADVRGRLCP